MPVTEVDGSVTERFQTTLPSHVRQVLGITGPGKVTWQIIDGDTIILKRKDVPQEDPALGAFLGLLERDIAGGNLLPATAALRDRLQDLVKDVEVGDLDQPLSAEPDGD